MEDAEDDEGEDDGTDAGKGESDGDEEIEPGATGSPITRPTRAQARGKQKKTIRGGPKRGVRRR
jgi:hypothetical protein